MHELCFIFHFSFPFSFNFCFVCFHTLNVLIFYVCISRHCQPKLFKDKITKLSRIELLYNKTKGSN